MGVKKLWKILSPVKERVSVESLRGKVLGVDLAVWVVQAENVVQGSYHGIYLRQLFFKVMHLLEHGIGVIVVTDGKAPILKAQTIANRLGVNLDRNQKVIQRRRFMKIMNECQEMLISMGVPVLKGESEGEGSAAKLQQDNRIDGVITTDGDAFLYGARVVYRNLFVTEDYCEQYRMNRIEYELGLSRDDLIALGILNGCDYNPEGITGLGYTTSLDYLLSRDRLRSATSELVSWVQQKDAILEKYEAMLQLKQQPHCSFCKHIGKKSDHMLEGCIICDNDAGSSCTKDSRDPCTCTKHVAKELLASPHMITRVRLTQTAAKRKLPIEDIINEFSSYSSPEVEIRWSTPDFHRYIYFMHDKLQWRKINAAERFVQIAALHVLSKNIQYDKPFHVTKNPHVEFIHILKERTKNQQPFYELEFRVTSEEVRGVLEFDTVYVVLGKDLVEHLLPGAVSEFKDRRTPVRRKKKAVPKPVVKKSPSPDTVKPVTALPSKAKSLPVKPKTWPGKPRGRRGVATGRPATARQQRSPPSPLFPPSDVESVTSAIDHLSLGSHDNPDFENDEELLPLAERLARRNKDVNATASSTTTSDPSLSLSSLSSSSSSTSSDEEKDGGNDVIDVSISSVSRTASDTGGERPEDEFFLTEENYIDDDFSEHDSNIQLLPQSFIEEYLDRSHDDMRYDDHVTDHVLGSRDEVERDLSAKSPSEVLPLDSSVEEGSRDLSSYHRASSEFHQLAFVTPLKPGETVLNGSFSPLSVRTPTDNAITVDDVPLGSRDKRTEAAECDPSANMTCDLFDDSLNDSMINKITPYDVVSPKPDVKKRSALSPLVGETSPRSKTSPLTPDNTAPLTPDNTSSLTPDVNSPLTHDNTAPLTPDNTAPLTPDNTSSLTPDVNSPLTHDSIMTTREPLGSPRLSSPFSPVSPLSSEHLMTTPDTSFLEGDVAIATPTWNRAPLSDIQNQVSTPKSHQAERVLKKPPLPHIPTTEENFNLNVTELLETN